ncbi:hypothetical protein NIES4074_24510 [Cylindrospermum sp. NIES-4074]|nr:hypothetical protein NIES4074_24510 [Cylindrospermum sp. NIES-4074]
MLQALQVIAKSISQVYLSGILKFIHPDKDN